MRYKEIVKSMIMDNLIVPVVLARTSVRDLYSLFVAYCQDQGMEKEPPKIQHFSQELGKYIHKTLTAHHPYFWCAINPEFWDEEVGGANPTKFIKYLDVARRRKYHRNKFGADHSEVSRTKRIDLLLRKSEETRAEELGKDRGARKADQGAGGESRCHTAQEEFIIDLLTEIGEDVKVLKEAVCPTTK